MLGSSRAADLNIDLDINVDDMATKLTVKVTTLSNETIAADCVPALSIKELKEK